MYICLCKGISEAQLLDMIARHSGSCDSLKQEMGLDGECCGRCEAQLDEIVSQFAVWHS